MSAPARWRGTTGLRKSVQPDYRPTLPPAGSIPKSHRKCTRGFSLNRSNSPNPLIRKEPLVGFEPTTCSLRMSCSTPELQRLMTFGFAWCSFSALTTNPFVGGGFLPHPCRWTSRHRPPGPGDPVELQPCHRSAGRSTRARARFGCQRLNLSFWRSIHVGVG